MNIVTQNHPSRELFSSKISRFLEEFGMFQKWSIEVDTPSKETKADEACCDGCGEHWNPSENCQPLSSVFETRQIF